MAVLSRTRVHVALLLLAVALALVGSIAWLLRDPMPRWRARRAEPPVVQERSPFVAGGATYQPATVRGAGGVEVEVVVRPPAPARDASGSSAAGDGVGGPAEGGAERRPVYLLIGGYRTGERAATLIDDPRGAIVAAMGYPYDGPLDVRGFAMLRHLPAIRRAVLDTPPSIQLVLDWLLARPDVDPARVELVGVSFGAFFAPAAAALDPRVTRLWLVHGAGRPYEVLEHGLASWARWAPARAALATLANLAFAGPRLAPERWVPLVAPRPVVMINATDDQRLPRSAVETLHASALPPSEVIWLAGDHVHPERSDLIRQLMNVVLDRAERP